MGFTRKWAEANPDLAGLERSGRVGFDSQHPARAHGSFPRSLSRKPPFHFSAEAAWKVALGRFITAKVERFHVRKALWSSKKGPPLSDLQGGAFHIRPSQRKTAPGSPEAVRCSLLSRLTETGPSVGATPPMVNACRNGTVVKGSLPPGIGPHCAFHVTAIPALCA